MVQKRALDLLSQDFEIVDVEDPISRCLGVFREKHPRVLIVYDSRRDRYLGVLTERMLYRAKIDPTRTKVKSVYRPAPRLSPEVQIAEIARLMIENDLRILPVFNEERLVGVVTDEAVLKTMAPLLKEKVEDLMTRNPISVNGHDSIAKALAVMRENGIARLPVVAGNRVVGIVTMHDIVHEILEPRVRASLGEVVGEKERPLRDPISTIMKGDIITVFPNDSVKKAIRLMLAYDISSLLVVEAGRRLTGLITRTDILQRIANMGGKVPKIAVQLSVKDPEGFGLDDMDRDKLLLSLEGFARHHEKFLKAASITIFIKRHKERRRGRRLTHVRIQINSSAGQFTGIGEGWGVNQAVKQALNHLDRRIKREKERLEMVEAGDVLLDEALGLLA